MSGKTLTAAALAKQLRVSQRTVIRWHQAGLLPPPTKVKGPSGRGWRSVWEDWVADRGRSILTWQKEGKTLPQIQAQLAGHALATTGQHRDLTDRFLNDSLADGTAPVDRFTRSMDDVLTRWPDKVRVEVVNFLRTRAALEPLFYILLHGENPVLSADEFGRIWIGPDYLVPRHFGFAYGDGEAIGIGDSYPRLFVGLYAPLRLVCREWAVAVPAPVVTAAPKIYAEEGDRLVEYAYVMKQGPDGLRVAVRVPNSGRDIGPALRGQESEGDQ